MARLLGALFLLGLSPTPLLSETLLIVPFYNSSNTKNIDWIGESLAETLSEALASEGILRVPSDDRRAALAELNLPPATRLSQATVFEIAINLDAGVTLYGDYSLANNTLRINCSLVDIRQMRRIAAITESAPLEDLSRLQNRLAWIVLTHLRPGAHPTLQSYLDANPPIRLDALENYIRGLLATTVEQRIRFFATAARLQPGFSEPSLRIGLIHLGRNDYRSAATWLAKVSPGLSRYREATFYLALSRFQLGEYAAAAALLDPLAQEAPLPEVLNNLGAARARLDRPDALDAFDRAIEANPADPVPYFNAGYYLWRKSRFEPAAARFRELLERTAEDELAATLLDRCEKSTPPQPGDPRAERQERVKTQYDESAWIMLNRLVNASDTKK